MAEHLRNEFARAGAAVRPSQVLTLANYLDRRTDVPAAAPAALVHRLIQEALDRLRPARFEKVARYRGFHQAIADLMNEAPDAPGGDLGTIIHDVERELGARGFALRNARLQTASEGPGTLPKQIVFDGFFSLAQAERKLIESFARRASLSITLPEADAELLRAGFVETRLSGTHRAAATRQFSAPSLDREVEEIARRILEEAARGRPFREMGVILRVREPYASALETVFARFSIPARFYFAGPLIQNPAIAYLGRIVRLMLGGWDHAELLSALRMPVSGIGATAEGDRFDFEARERLPASGLPLPDRAAFLHPFETWPRERLTPIEWSARLKQLRSIVPLPPIEFDRTNIEMCRSVAWGLDAFRETVEESSRAFHRNARLPLEEFWEQVELALTLDRGRMEDRRRNVVHVMDVFEARQWELPLVFVCGLTERHFPQYHREDALIGDAARRRAGLETSADRQRQERFLFELAMTRATETTILSYSRFDEKGDPALRSFFLDGEAPLCGDRVRPTPVRPVSAAANPAIRADALLAELAKIHRSLAPTAIESFLQCPFQFYAGRTLRLRARPAAPRERLDNLLQGTILHRLAAEATRMPLFGPALFDEVFAEECQRARVPDGYRKEAVRLELARNFEAFLRDRQVVIAWESRVEQEFRFALSPILEIRGRIDRLDAGPRAEALVIDYKYSAPDTIRDRARDDKSENFVQAGLYLIAAEEAFELKPAGMLFCGLKKQVTWDGWHAPVRGLEGIGESCTMSRLRGLMDDARQRTLEALDAIGSGKIAPQPADRAKCARCDFRDICRIESEEAARGAGA